MWVKSLLKQKTLAILFICILSLLCSPENAINARASEEHLTLLFTNDTHNRLEPFQHVELKKQVGGVLRRQRYFQQVQANNPQTLILDAGDVFQGTPYYNFYLGEPDIQAMSLMGYDAMTVGNHDLDNGLENLKAQTQFAAFPVLNANIVDEKTGLLVFRPYHIFNVYGRKVAVIGLMSEHSWQAVGQANKKGLKLLNPFQAANQIVAKIRPHVDVIISLHHMGIWDDEVFPQKVPGIDVIIGGHSHTLMEKARLIPNQNTNGIQGTLLQHAYHMGAYVGRIDLEFDTQGHIKNYDSQLVLMDDNFDKDPVKDMLNTYSNKLAGTMNQVIGECLQDMGTDGKYNGPFALGNWVSDVLRLSQKTDIAIMNTGGIRSGLPQGPITIGKIYEIMPFDNAITTFKLKGEDLRKIVEINTSRLGISKNMQFSGLTYTIKGQHVTEIRVQGQLLDTKKTYTVVAPDYVFGGNEDMSFASATDAKATGLLIRDLLMEYVKTRKKVEAPQDQRLIRLGAS